LIIRPSIINSLSDAYSKKIIIASAQLTIPEFVLSLKYISCIQKYPEVQMKRRDFFNTLVKGTIAAAAMNSLPLFERLAFSEEGGKSPANPVGASLESSGKVRLSSTPPDIIGLRNGSPEAMFESAIKALGGIGRFVPKGSIVLVKPNIGWNKTPAEGANTNPGLVGAIVRACLHQGAKKVFVMDHTCNEWQSCYSNSGIQEAAVAAGATVIPANAESSYREVTIRNGRVLRRVQAHETFLDADVVINVPVLKHHMGARMTCALKNFMGVVWDRRAWHKEGLHDCIADFSLLRKADLTIVDAFTVMTRNGPRGVSPNDLVMKKMLIAGVDAVAIDTAAARILDAPMDEIPYLSMAEGLGIGTVNLEKLKIERITL
jgi:uncharacterized protein (DUF362 family)